MEAVQEDGLVNTKVGTCKMQYRYTGKKEKKKKEGMTGGRRLRRKNGVEKMHKPKTKRKE